MASTGAAPDHLFNLRNQFYLGAYQTAINNSEIPHLSPEDAVERDCLVFRSYIALGSYQVSLNRRSLASRISRLTDLLIRISLCVVKARYQRDR